MNIMKNAILESICVRDKYSEAFDETNEAVVYGLFVPLSIATENSTSIRVGSARAENDADLEAPIAERLLLESRAPRMRNTDASENNMAPPRKSTIGANNVGIGIITGITNEIENKTPNTSIGTQR